MLWQGTIDFLKPIRINGKPHGVEHETTLPVWNGSKIGSVVHAEDTDKLWFGGSSSWLELTPGGIGVHDHNDIYYTETEVDAFFEAEVGGKKQIDYSNVANKPATFTPSSHDNTSHSVAYITSSDVTFETLQTNGDIGIAATQLAIGSHNHDTIYSLKSHTHTESNISDLDKYTQAEVNNITSQIANELITEINARAVDDQAIKTLYASTGLNAGASLIGVNDAEARFSASNVEEILQEIAGSGRTIESLKSLKDDIGNLDKYTQAEVNTLLSAKSDTNHLHTGVYEPVITKQTGFNLPLGTTENTVAEGNHTHNANDLNIQTTKSLYVDVNRSDIYIEDGSILKPYKTIQAAINKIIDNNDNTTNPYNIMIENGKYYETIVLENLNLHHISLIGNGVAQIRPTTNESLKSTTNNTNLKTLHLKGITFLAPVVITGSAGTTAFNDLIWDDCNFVAGDGAQKANITITCINNITMRRIYFDIDNITYNNVNYSVLDDSNIGAMFNININSETDLPAQNGMNVVLINSSLLMGAPVFTQAGAAALQFITNNSTLLAGMSAGTITIPSGVTVSAYGSYYRGTWTNNSTLILRNSNVNSILGTAPIVTGQPSSQIGYVPSGSTTAVNVQDAITQLATTTVLPIITTAPSDTPAVGTMRYDSADNKLYVYNGTTWKSVTLA